MNALKAFFKTTVGQLSAVAIALGLILGALLLGPKILDLLNPSSEISQVKRTTTSIGEDKEIAAKEALVDAPDKYDIYESKDPFKPLIEPVADGEGTDGEGAAGGNALVVESIVLENGVYYANITYGGTSYKVKDGDRVGTSPYEVVTITADRVLLLYGDEATPAAPGEEIIK